MLSLLLVACVLSQSWGEPVGAPSRACDNMTPRHNFTAPQEGPAPYTLSFEADGDDFTVTLEADEGVNFRGFFIQARDGGDEDAMTGTFSGFDDDSQERPCPDDDSDDNGATHVLNDDKTSVSVTWSNSDGVDTDAVFFRATVVQTFDTFWIEVDSETIGSR